MTTEVLTPTTLGGLRVQKVKEQTPYINLLVYGDYGVGKTRLGGSADAVPEMRKVLFVDVEGGTLTLRDSYPNVDIVRIVSWSDMQALYDELFAGSHGYNTIVLDSLTEIQRFNMTHVMNQTLEMATEQDRNKDPDLPELRDWGKSSEQIRRFVRAFRDLPINTIFTCLAKDDKHPKTGIVTKRPDLPGKLAQQVPAFFDVVLYMFMKEVDDTPRRLLLATSTDTIAAKDRSNKLPPVVEDPTMETLYKTITTTGGNK